MRFIVILLSLVLTTKVYSTDQKVVDLLQSVSVTVTSGTNSGSGVVITRKIKCGNKDEDVNFIFTAGHVVDNLRSVRTIIEDGKEKKIIEFKTPKITQNIIQNGITIGRLDLDTKVLKYSDSEHGIDLAVLIVLKRDWIKESAKFTLGDTIIPVGTNLIHVGSLLGQEGANSMTTGIMSQIGRILDVGSRQGILVDQISVGAFPGSSGGGIFTQDGTYIGMLTRGVQTTFVFMVPTRVINKYLEEKNLLWIIDPSKEPPTLDEINKIKVEE